MADLVDPGDLFITPAEPEAIMAEALAYKPRAIFAGFSGGDDSLVSVHWMMTNVPGCQVVHINTGIGLQITRRHVRETCARYGWPLIEIRAKEDCDQDYREHVLKWGFPGPAMHARMYQRLKGRAVEKLVREHKQHRRDKILIATGIHYEESKIRMGYGERTINFVGSQMWVNPLYWWPKDRFVAYREEYKLRRNPASELLGMSGECLCGAFAETPDEKALIRIIEPETAAYLDALEAEVRAAGHDWGWDERPPRAGRASAGFRPLCRGCEKTAALPIREVAHVP